MSLKFLFIFCCVCFIFFAVELSFGQVNNGDDLGLGCTQIISGTVENECGICRSSASDSAGCNTPSNSKHAPNTCATASSADALAYQEARPSTQYQLVCIHISTDTNGNRKYLPSWKKVGHLAEYFANNGNPRYSPWNAIAGTIFSDNSNIDCTCGEDLRFSLGGGGGLTGSPPNIVGGATCYEKTSTSRRWYQKEYSGGFDNDVGVWEMLKNDKGINQYYVTHVGYQVISNNAFYKVEVGSSSSPGIPPQNWIYRYTGDDISSAEAWSTLTDWEPLLESDLYQSGRPHHTFAPGTIDHGFMVAIPDDPDEHWVWVIQGFKYCISRYGCGGYGRTLSKCNWKDRLGGMVVQPQIIVVPATSSQAGQIQIGYRDQIINTETSKHIAASPILRRTPCSNSKWLTYDSYDYADPYYQLADGDRWGNWCPFEWDMDYAYWVAADEDDSDWNDAGLTFKVTIGGCNSCEFDEVDGAATGLIRFDPTEVGWGIGTDEVVYSRYEDDGWTCVKYTGPWFTCCDPFPECDAGEEINADCICVPCAERTCSGDEQWNSNTCQCDPCTPVPCWSTSTPSADPQCDGSTCKYRAQGQSECTCETTCDVIPCSYERDNIDLHLPPQCRPCKTCGQSRSTLCPDSLSNPPTHKWVPNEPDQCECIPCEQFFGTDTNDPDHPSNNCAANTFYDQSITPCQCVPCRDYLWDGRVEYDNEGKSIYWPNANGECRGTYEPSPDECSPCVPCEQVCQPGEKPDPDYGKRLTKTIRPSKHKQSSKKNILPKIPKNRHPLFSLNKLI